MMKGQFIMNEKLFDKSYDYFVEHQTELAQSHHGKFAVVYDGTVVEISDDERAAFVKARKNYPAGSFLIRKCIRPEEESKAIFHSQVL